MALADDITPALGHGLGAAIRERLTEVALRVRLAGQRRRAEACLRALTERQLADLGVERREIDAWIRDGRRRSGRGGQNRPAGHHSHT